MQLDIFKRKYQLFINNCSISAKCTDCKGQFCMLSITNCRRICYLRDRTICFPPSSVSRCLCQWAGCGRITVTIRVRVFENVNVANANPFCAFWVFGGATVSVVSWHGLSSSNVWPVSYFRRNVRNNIRSYLEQRMFYLKSRSCQSLLNCLIRRSLRKRLHDDVEVTHHSLDAGRGIFIGLVRMAQCGSPLLS